MNNIKNTDMHDEKVTHTDLEGLRASSGEIEVSDGKRIRTAVAVRDAGIDSVHTYRIPGLVTSKKGTLLAIYDVRRDSERDLQGDIDIGLSRSTDGGFSWEPMRIVMDMNEWGDLPRHLNGCSDANILVDDNTGDIFVAAAWMHGDFRDLRGGGGWIHQWHSECPGPGLGVEETTQFLMVKSSDDGLSWSEPVNLTRELKRPEWNLLCPGPGRGITMSDGTLVMPVQGRDENNIPFSTVITSRDHGETWKVGHKALDTEKGTTESSVVELADGSLMLNMRDNRNHSGNSQRFGRSVSVSDDLGMTWVEHESSGRKILPTSRCMASLHRHDYIEEGEKKSILLFFNPASWNSRSNFTLKVSFDQGMSWPEEYHLPVEQNTGYGYSCITSIDEETIGIIYEGGSAHMTFLSISLEEILKR